MITEILSKGCAEMFTAERKIIMQRSFVLICRKVMMIIYPIKGKTNPLFFL